MRGHWPPQREAGGLRCPVPATRALDLPIRAFTSQAAFHRWLHTNHARSPGIWLRFYKKTSGVTSVTYAEALDEALCYGWIDGQLRSFDEQSYLRRFTPRRPRSVWSQINVGHVERLIALGRMHAAGLRQVEAAKADGRWARAYAPAREMKVPQDFLDALARHRKARVFFETLNRTHRFAIAYRVQSATRPETRARRIAEIIARLKEGRTLR